MLHLARRVRHRTRKLPGGYSPSSLLRAAHALGSPLAESGLARDAAAKVCNQCLGFLPNLTGVLVLP